MCAFEGLREILAGSARHLLLHRVRQVQQLEHSRTPVGLDGLVLLRERIAHVYSFSY